MSLISDACASAFKLEEHFKLDLNRELANISVLVCSAFADRAQFREMVQSEKPRFIKLLKHLTGFRLKDCKLIADAFANDSELGITPDIQRHANFAADVDLAINSTSDDNPTIVSS